MWRFYRCHANLADLLEIRSGVFFLTIGWHCKGMDGSLFKLFWPCGRQEGSDSCLQLAQTGRRTILLLLIICRGGDGWLIVDGGNLRLGAEGGNGPVGGGKGNAVFTEAKSRAAARSRAIAAAVG